MLKGLLTVIGFWAIVCAVIAYPTYSLVALFIFLVLFTSVVIFCEVADL